MSINLDVEEKDRNKLLAIGCRALKLKCGTYPEDNAVDIAMDVAATHLNGCPLDLDKLLAFDDMNFAHDVANITKFVDRRTGKLAGHFLPKSAQKAAPLAPPDLDCPECGGTGEVEFEDEIEACEVCDGSGVEPAQ